MLTHIIEGIVVALVIYLIGRNRLTTKEIILVSLIAIVSHIIIHFLIFRSSKKVESIQIVPSVSTTKTDEVVGPVAGVPVTDDSSEINGIRSRWMGWKMTDKPLNKNTDEYMIYPSYYSKLTIRPGYHENIVPSNTSDHPDFYPESLISSQFSDVSSSGMTGGGDTPVVVNTTVGPVGGNGLGLTEDRLNNVLYSGDLIDIMSGDKIIQRMTNNSQVILAKPLPTVKTNLSKVRIENMTSTPIKYQENIYIRHNAMVDNVNQIRSIKYGERVQSHQTGSTYELFKLYNSENSNSTDYVKYGDKFVIACGDQTGDKVYLKLEADGSISSEGIKTDGIIFTASLNHPFDKSSLCVCPNETIYP